MLKGDELEPKSWLRCPLTCARQDATSNSNLTRAKLILFLNLLTHMCDNKPAGAVEAVIRGESFQLASRAVQGDVT